MTFKMTPLNIAVIALVVIGAMLLLNMCGIKEGMSHRVPTTRVLQDNAYGYKQLPTYTTKYNYNLNSRENYTPEFRCEKLCQNVEGNTPNEDCYFECMNRQVTGTHSGIECSHDDECGPRELCVKPGYYNPGKGYCMSDNEPGVISPHKLRKGVPVLTPAQRRLIPAERKLKRGVAVLRPGVGTLSPGVAVLRKGKKHAIYHTGPVVEKFGRSRTCGPEEFFNDSTGVCEPRFQGVSSAYAVHHARPGPEPSVSLPGTTLPGYGVGMTDPKDVLTNFRLQTDQ